MLLDRNFDYRTQPTAAAGLDGSAKRSVEEFLYREARLLDERSFEEWLTRWSAEGRYWMPRHHGQDNPFEQISLFYENSMLMETRIRRLRNDRNWSQQPVTRSVRLVGNITVDGCDAAGRVIVRSCLQYTEHRLVQRHLAAEVFHKLESDGSGGWKVYLKRVNLVNCDGVHDSLEVFL